MGCCLTSKHKKPSIRPILDKSRISSDQPHGQTLPTSRGTVQLLYNSEFNEKLCLKLRIFEEFQEVFPASVSESCENNPSLTSYKKNIRYIKKSWNLFKTSFSYFSDTTHGCCIENYSITDGIVIMMILSLASGKILDKDISLINEPPFILFNSENDETSTLITKSWESLSRVIQSFCLKKLVKLEKVILKFEALLESYQEYEPDEGEEKEFRKSEKNIRKLVDCAQGLKNDVVGAIESIKEFVNSFEERRSRIEDLGKEAQEKGYCTGEYIVHLLLNK